MALPLFAVTLFLSAFILFLVQPIVGKMILPKLGGTPQVWNTCMVFFQTALLAGYFYTHSMTTYLKLRYQLILHSLLLFLPLAILLPQPFNIVAWEPTFGSNPVFETLYLLMLKVGIPFLIVATSAPLLQKWFASTGHPAAKDPYFLYGASNLGSMLALLLYPVAVEPWLPLTGQRISKAEVVAAGTNYQKDDVLTLKGGKSESPARVQVKEVTPEGGIKEFTLKSLEGRMGPYSERPPEGPLEVTCTRKDKTSSGDSEVGKLGTGATFKVTFPFWSQTWLYTYSYALLILFVIACVGLVWTTMTAQHPTEKHPSAEPPPTPAVSPAPAPASAPSTPQSTQASAAADASKTGVKKGPARPAPKQGGKSIADEDLSIKKAGEEVTGWRRLRWVALAAVPCSLMLGITTHITTDLSPMPLFWLIPLTFYLLSFILVYMRWPFVWVDQAHTICLVAQPIAVAAMILADVCGMASSNVYIKWVIIIDVAAFFLTALVYHGELAKDRPSTRYLTEFYLLMSVGGMLGGMFNGLIAPIFFWWGVAEFPIAIFLSSLFRPKMKEDSWTDRLLVGMLEQPHQHQHAKAHAKGQKPAPHTESATSYAGLLDFVLPLSVMFLLLALIFIVLPKQRGEAQGAQLVIVYGLPLLISCLFYARPLRLGLTIGLVLGVSGIFSMMEEGNKSLFSARSYFGIIHVKAGNAWLPPGDEKAQPYTYHQLVHGHILHGQNFQDPKYSRLATTYYHRYGPVGVVMEKFNWFSQGGPDYPGNGYFMAKQNTYHSDARLPMSLIGSAGGLDGALSAFVAAHSEPAYATIGLGTGTMASYGRPYQHVHFYEIDNNVRKLSLPNPGGKQWFNYLQGAMDRGSIVQVRMGDARQRMAKKYAPYWPPEEARQEAYGEIPNPTHVPAGEQDGTAKGGGPTGFYHMMVVDAFSSDAIPAHLLTREAVQMYFTKLTEEGILCVHTSNRFVNLPLVVAAVANDLNLAYYTGHDSPWDKHTKDKPAYIGHSTSEWVMVARKAKYLSDHLFEPNKNSEGRYVQNPDLNPRYKEEYWRTGPTPDPRYLWTDDDHNLLWVMRMFQ